MNVNEGVMFKGISVIVIGVGFFVVVVISV